MKKIIGICGSNRNGSYNMAVLNYVNEVISDRVDFEILDISKLPMFNQDLEKDLSTDIKEFEGKLMNADGFVIVSPEYNYSIPPLLKNALDWGSRLDNNCFNNKPVSIMSASPGIFGGARMQYQLRQVFVCLNLIAINKPEVMIGKVHEKIDDNGIINDDYTKKIINDSVDELINKLKV